jgi:membrane fusion protein (multidrug efflux system)
MKVYVDEGDRVHAGDVLAELDKEELNAQLRSANAQLQKLQSDYGRSKQLFEEGLAAKAEYDNARYSYEQQLAAVNQQQVQLANMTIRAPISGVITVKHIQQGDLVSSGAPAFDLVDPNSYILTINPPEQILPRVKVGQTARVRVDAVEGSEFEAKVRRINPSVDPNTGTVKVILDFAKDEMARLRESAFARIRLVMDTRDDALLVPKDAVVEENARKYLFIIEPRPEDAPEDAETGNSGAKTMIATRVEVQTGLEDNAKVEIIDGIDGLSPIVTVGQQTLKTGSEVKLTTAQDELLAKAGLSADEALKAAEAERARGAKTVDRRTGM